MPESRIDPDPGATPDPTVHAAVRDEPLVVDDVLARVRTDAVGGIGVFIGTVRDHDGGRGVSGLEYQAHPSATQVLGELAGRLAREHGVLAVAVEHRSGSLSIGEVAVVVAVGAAHRGPALTACRELIDTLKTELPVWKRQDFGDGDSEWVGIA